MFAVASMVDDTAQLELVLRLVLRVESILQTREHVCYNARTVRMRIA